MFYVCMCVCVCYNFHYVVQPCVVIWQINETWTLVCWGSFLWSSIVPKSIFNRFLPNVKSTNNNKQQCCVSLYNCVLSSFKVCFLSAVNALVFPKITESPLLWHLFNSVFWGVLLFVVCAALVMVPSKQISFYSFFRESNVAAARHAQNITSHPECMGIFHGKDQLLQVQIQAVM